MDFSKQIIWLLREPRSGSTWFSRKLGVFLNRPDKWFDNRDQQEMENFFVSRKQQDTDCNIVFDTHYFCALKGLKNYTDPIVLRVTRKNKVEQFLSKVIATKYNHNQVFNILSEEERNNLPKIEKTVVPMSEVREFIRKSKQNDSLWKEYSPQYRSETIYYEDLLNGFSSKIFPITNWSMQIEEEGMPLKLPYNKKDIFVNYEQVRSLIKQEMQGLHEE